jgi:hypothetical protein
VVGTRGTILFTSTAGSDWSLIDVGIEETFWRVYFSNHDRGFISGDNGVLLATLDGGKTWEQHSSGTCNTLYDIDFIDEKIGFLAGNYSTVLKTTNGGGVGKSEISSSRPQPLAIFPDPVSDKLTISIWEDISWSGRSGVLAIYNLAGRQIIRQDVKESRFTIDVGFLSQGIYFARFIATGRTFVTKFVKLGH